jgi:poly-gamma-glutamate capsule biosynthesis protein CapA/YwtB (metallophosphatase superfamily)
MSKVRKANSPGIRFWERLPYSRRRFLKLLGATAFGPPATEEQAGTQPEVSPNAHRSGAGPITLFLCGDVMTGRGIDQVLPHPAPPRLHEPCVKDAREYAVLAERSSGAIPRPADFAYIWGDALAGLERAAPDARIANLETAITTSEDWWVEKGIHYRMNPANIPCLQALGLDCGVLANNHVLDWNFRGLADTLAALERAGIKTAGAGRNAAAARAPAVLEVAGKGRVLVFGLGLGSSGIPEDWAAAGDRPGVNRLPDLSESTLMEIGAAVRAVKRAGDVAVASIHWGGNWGYSIPLPHREFAHRLIETAGIDLVHGHSSHHPLGIEVHRGKLVLYGCGDFINDYEGIEGYEEFRDDLTLMYFPVLEPAAGRLQRLEMTPLRIRRFRLQYPSEEEFEWLRARLDRECRPFGGRVERSGGNRLALRWA